MTPTTQGSIIKHTHNNSRSLPLVIEQILYNFEGSNQQLAATEECRLEDSTAGAYIVDHKQDGPDGVANQMVPTSQSLVSGNLRRPCLAVMHFYGD